VIRGRLLASAALGLTLLGLGPATAQAELLDANCPGPPDGGTSTSVQAQTFTAVHTGTLVRGEMFVAKEPGPDFQMFILAAGPSGPMGGALGSTTIPDSAVANVPSPSPSGPSAPVTGTFSPGVSVTAGQQYAIVVTRPGGDWVTKDRRNNPCPGNEYGGTVGGTWTLREPDFDFPFSTYVNPTNAFTIGKVKGKRVSLTLPGPGGVDVASAAQGGSKAVAAAKKLVKASHTDVASAGTVSIPVRLTKLGKSKLRRKGKLKVRAAITYTPTGGLANAQTAKLKLKRK
jgi:hypothetical protein